MNIEAGGSPGAAEPIFGQEMPQLPQRSTTLRRRDLLDRKPVGLSERGVNFLAQGAEECLGPCLNKAGDGVMGQGNTLFAIFRILAQIFCVIKQTIYPWPRLSHTRACRLMTW